MFTTTRDMRLHAGSGASLRGWLVSKQARGRIRFLTLRDGTGTAQLDCERGALPETEFDRLRGLPLETPLEAEGKVAEREGGGAAELRVAALRHGPEYLW
jgi:aspartyl/asparaginyl-tRNA synthetase